MEQPEDRDRAVGQAPEQAPEPPPLEGDFADEHSSPTFADQLAGGPEGEPETESPEGYAGMESRGVAKRRGGNRTGGDRADDGDDPDDPTDGRDP